MSTQPSRAASSITMPGVEAPSTPEHEHNDIEAQEKHHHAPAAASHWSLVTDQTHVTPEVLNHKYKGSGTHEDPYVVEFLTHDRRNPMEWAQWKKWVITITMAFVTLAVSLVSSAYTGGVTQIAEEVSWFSCCRLRQTE